MARPKADEAQDTRQLALDKAARLIQQRGYNGVSMNVLAKEAGVRKASLYHHFPEGKEQLVLEMLEAMIKRHSSGYQTAIRGGEGIQAKLEQILAFSLAENSEVSHVVNDSLRFLSQDKQDYLGELFATHQYLRIKAVMDEAVATGELRKHDTTLSTWMFLSFMGELGVLEDYVSKADFPCELVTLFLKGLRNA